MREHLWITASALGLLEQRGIEPGSVDIIYSQAAAYFEQDFTMFLRSAARLLRDQGVLLFNHDPAFDRDG
ncbi:methyltransferase domain-containing protein [Pantoea vagans]|uniref:methyltransferase domain-containing protein n=1 Tax=Pantoea vagans TaxID=470934 RepID=UPI0031194B3C